MLSAAESFATSASHRALLSVVVASFRDACVLEACLDSLLPQCANAGVELIVARADEPAALASLESRYPQVRFVSLASGTDIPRLRGAGLAVASGSLAALTEDHCVADPGWVATMTSHAEQAADVIGGAMDNARHTRALDWGAFFAEYGFFAGMSSRHQRVDGATILLTGANVAYSRRVLPQVVAWTTDGAWENVVHDRLREAGAILLFEPDARVSQNLTYAFGPFVADRFRHGYDYARVRLAESPAMSRIGRIAASLLLPPVLTWRVGRAAVGSLGRAVAFIRALPFTLVFLGAWSAGEAMGYLRGASTAPRSAGDT